MTEKPLRGQIWDVVLEPVCGEQLREHNVGEPRTVIVLSLKGRGRPAMRVCVPVSEFQDAHAFLRWCVPFFPNERNGLSRPSTADAS